MCRAGGGFTRSQTEVPQITGMGSPRTALPGESRSFAFDAGATVALRL